MTVENDNCGLWPEYYQEFPYFSDQIIRPGCQPRKLVHTHRVEKAIVLVHGLTDSPFYMKDIGEYFYETLGYNVYSPLLQCHGLKDPQGMAGVSLGQWKKNVQFALRTASESADRVSIGGLSTGGALSFYFGCTDPEITDDIYLFSAALGLYGGRFAVFGRILEFLLRIPFFRFFDNRKPLVGDHPYRYDRIPLNSAGELAQLILEIDELLKAGRDKLQGKRIFAVWSEFDKVINWRKLSKLQAVTRQNKYMSYIIPKAAQVDHACVVLREPVYASGGRSGETLLETANPQFVEMMAALRSFESAE